MTNDTKTTDSQKPASTKGLGKGLGALIDNANYNAGGGTEVPKPTENQTYLSVTMLEPSGFQPRHYFDEDQLKALSSSIKSQGVLQPLLVRAIEGKENRYEIIAGERRWRASQMAGLKEVPAIVLTLPDGKALEVALVENIQRSDLNPIDEAAGYLRLVNEFNYTHEDMARVTGKSRSHITNLMRLLSLPERIKDLVAESKLSMGHARALLGLGEEELQMRAALKVMKKALSVRETEELVRNMIAEENGDKKKRTRASKDMATRELESHMAKKLGMGVSILKKNGQGTIKIEFRPDKELQALLETMGMAS